MSFSSECRAETARVDAGRACCQETELRALTACSASYTLQGRGAVSLVYRVGSIPAARRIFVLLKNCFKVVPTLEYIQSPRFGGQRVCVLRVRDADTRRLMRLPRGGIHTVPVRSLNRKCCFQAYLRGVFLAAGYVTDPKKNYHLELRFPTPALAERCSARLADRGLSPRTAPGERADTVLFDRGDDIASFLTMIGASRAMLQFEDLRVRRDSKKRAHRMMNCDRANLKRQAGASANLISALEGIDLETLPPDLKSAAELRLENPDTSVAELAALADPPMTKSGLYHRLQRLRAFLEEGAVP